MTTARRVVVREPIAEAGVELLRAQGFDVAVDAETPLAEMLADATH